MKRITAILFLFAASILPAATLNIEYEVSVLNAPTNEFRYTYFVSGDLLPVDHYFEILFPANTYTSFTNEVATGWDVILLPIDSFLNLPGRYSALSLPSTFAGPFSVDFIWAGGGNGPGSQTFELYDDNFDLQLTGTTTLRQTSQPPGNEIPEPSTLAILASGLTLLVTLKKR
jgi:hypothetical protein